MSETKKPTPKNSVSPEPAKREAVPSAPYVLGNGETDEVSLSRIVYKNKASRKVVSVVHLQRRLAELGYIEAASDVQGWYGDLTAASVATFQSDEGLEISPYAVDSTFLELLFDGDQNVTLAP